MNEEKKQQMTRMVQDCVDYLREVPEGTELSFIRVLTEVGGSLEGYDFSERMMFQTEFYEAAEKAGYKCVSLDVIVGMAWVCPFILHHGYIVKCGGISPIPDEKLD